MLILVWLARAAVVATDIDSCCSVFQLSGAEAPNAAVGAMVVVVVAVAGAVIEGRAPPSPPVAAGPGGGCAVPPGFGTVNAMW